MSSFDLTEQIERLVGAGMPHIQGIPDDTYRSLWPAKIERPPGFGSSFDRALCIDAFPLYPAHIAVDRGSRRVLLPTRLLPLPGQSSPSEIVFGSSERHVVGPLVDPKLGEILRYVIFWQSGERWKGMSPNAAYVRMDEEECGLHLNEGLHLVLQENGLLKERGSIPLVGHMNERGETYFVRWEDSGVPSFHQSFGNYVETHGTPTRAKEVLIVSIEDLDFFLPH